MGLLSFRKKPSDEEEPTAAPVAADATGSNLSNDEWLAGIERREAEVAPEPEAAPLDASYDYPVEEHHPVNDAHDDLAAQPGPAIDAQYQAAAEQMAHVQTPAAQAPHLAAPTQAPGLAANYPNMGIVYAGLDTAGVAAFPSEAPAPVVAETPVAPAFEPTPTPGEVPQTIENGPLGPEAVDSLNILGLNFGCSWDEVATTRRAIMDALPNTGSPEEQQARAEVNHAYATLRLLRVGPLKIA